MGIILKRIVGFIIDLMIGGLVSIIIDNIPLISPYAFYVGILYLIFRDTITLYGSVGKKFLKLKLTGKSKVPFLNKVLRNITVFIWPIEGLILLLTKKRIGDMLFKTDVIPDSARMTR